MCIGVFNRKDKVKKVGTIEEDILVFRELVENSDTIYVMTGPDHRIFYISPGIRKLGVDPILFHGKDIAELICPANEKEWTEFLETPGGPVEIEARLNVPRGMHLCFRVTRYGFQGPSETCSQAFQIQNITQYKSKIKELLAANAQLDQIIFKTTHDLRAPLMSALGLLSLTEKAEDAERTEYLGLLKKSLMKLNAFIEEMNNFYRTGKMAVQREPIHWKELIHEELESQRTLYQPERVNIETDIRQDVEFYSDRLRIKTILTNLVTNAIKYADHRKPKHNIRIAVEVNRESAILKVTDNGIGIDKQYHDRIFDMFFRATDQVSGTGLGLFILRDTVERLQGRVQVDSQPGQGSTFTVYLPNRFQDPAGEDIRAGSRSFS